ncbi:MAG: hypothetical protein IJ509_03350 [Bacilli bacterium]|nr:hypothetical protein [Bacilli bacterium]
MEERNNLNLVRIENTLLSKQTKEILINKGKIKTLQDLLLMDYNKLKNLEGIETKHLLEINKYVNLLGFNYFNETNKVSETRKTLMENGVKLLEEEGLPIDLCLYLYQNDIYTLKELIMNYSKLDKVVGLSKKGRISLELELQRLDYREDDTLLKNTELSTYICSILYQNNIFTVRELLKDKNLEKVFGLKGLGINGYLELTDFVIKYRNNNLNREDSLVEESEFNKVHVRRK